MTVEVPQIQFLDDGMVGIFGLGAWLDSGYQRQLLGAFGWFSMFSTHLEIGHYVHEPLVSGSSCSLFRVPLAQCLVRLRIHVLYHPGWLLEVDSPSWRARRRQRQWHVPYWFCWFDAPRAMFPRLPAVCRSMLQLLTSCTWKSGYYFYEPLCFSLI